jgi:hypothetical protein
MRALAVASFFVGSFAIACAGTELASGDAEADPPVVAAAAVASPSAPNAARTAPAEPSPQANPAPVVAPRGEDAPFDSRWADEVRSVVVDYERWGRVDDEARWAPWLCRIPMAATAYISESDDADTHGHKLYTLYAMDAEAYGARRSDGGPSRLAGLSQVIVKESFAPVPLDDVHDAKLERGANGAMGMQRLRPAERDGRRFVAGERKGLFIMMKTEGSTEGTDAGWVYATVDPDMITVTAVGAIGSCMGCHAEAGDDRLFGLPGLAAPASPSPRKGNANVVPL